MSSRIPWKKYAMKMAYIASERSEDPNVQVGACILRKNHTIAGIGFNGLPSGIDVDVNSWDYDELRNLMIHAEANALKYCRPEECHSIAITRSPCIKCLVNGIAAYGIKQVYYDVEHKDFDQTQKIAKLFDITLEQVSI